MKFGLIGDGKIAKRHRAAIDHVRGEISKIYDPKYEGTETGFLRFPRCWMMHFFRILIEGGKEKILKEGSIIGSRLR
jgi:hypothetical protein